MKAYKRKYLKSIGAGEQDVVICEFCRKKPAVDVHHSEMKKMGGSKLLDGLSNLIGLCRGCHNRAHDGTIDKSTLLKIAARRVERIGA